MSVTLRADLLTHLFVERKINPGSIADYKTAILFNWNRESGYQLPSDHRVIKDLMKGFRRDSPRHQKRIPEWDLKLVLEFFRSERFADWNKVPDKDLTLNYFLSSSCLRKRGGS